MGVATGRLKRWQAVLGGTALMLAFVAVVLLLLVRQAGQWGVPYFSFTSAHGSPCRNDLIGYTCTPLTLADIEFFGDVNLPNDATVVSGRYRATHDYQLDAQVKVPARSAASALKRLTTAYGRCGPTRPVLPMTGLRQVCVMATDDGASPTGEQPSSRIYSVATGVSKDGSRLVNLTVRSR